MDLGDWDEPMYARRKFDYRGHQVRVIARTDRLEFEVRVKLGSIVDVFYRNDLRDVELRVKKKIDDYEERKIARYQRDAENLVKRLHAYSFDLLREQ